MRQTMEIQPIYNPEDIYKCAKKILQCCNDSKVYKFTGKGKFEDIKNHELLNIENGVYLFLQMNEDDRTAKRIVRVGTHNKNNRLIKRLSLHCGNSIKGTVFRELVRDCLIKKGEKSKPESISEYINGLRIVVIPVNDESNKGIEKRLRIEEQLIATLSWAAFLFSEFRPEKDETDLFTFADNEQIKKIGLWLSDGMFCTPFKSEKEIETLFMQVKNEK